MPITNRLQFFHPAPDVEVMDSSGRIVRISSLWSRQTLLLAFTRHFGCPQCKELLSELVEGQGLIEQAGLQLAVVTQGQPTATAEFCSRFAPNIWCLTDPSFAAYRAFGLGRGALRQTVLSPAVLRSNERLRRSKGWKPELPPAGQDAMLMSGLFIIGTDGRIRLPYYYDHIADHPPLELLLHGILGVGWNRPFEGPITGQTGQTGQTDLGGKP
jgi:peroxiredoxin